MKTPILLALICAPLLTPSLFAQTKTSADTTSVVTVNNYAIRVLAGLVLVAPSLFGPTDAPGSREQLQELTAQLQKSPNDEALREKIIGLALTLNPKPTTPDAAIMAEGGAEYAFKNAKSNSDYSDAGKQYEKALLLAPWLAADYFNCGMAHEKAGENKEAIRSFNLYLLAAPNAEDTLAVKKRIGGLQYAAQKANNEANSPEGQGAKQFKSLDGGIWQRVSYSYKNQVSTDNDPDHAFFITIHGNEFDLFQGHGAPYPKNDDDVIKTTFSTREFGTRTIGGGYPGCSATIVISEDGLSISVDLLCIPAKYIYKRINK